MENLNNTENNYLDNAEDITPVTDVSEATKPEAAPKSASGELITVVGVRFKTTGKVYYFSPKGATYANGDNVVVDTSRGIEYGTVCMPNRSVHSSEIVLPVREVLRKATAEDTARRRKNEELEINAFNTFIERIDAHGLEMKLIDVECAFDNSKLLFYFSAESRIDFRELVRELAGIFHTRIELRQIGIRDEAKMLGGLGICGRPFCCASFLSDFVQVSIKMAKEQNLSLNSAKISGACGRLMCCLRYEYDSYLAEKALTPKVGAEVMTPDGEGVVAEANPMTGIVKVKLAGTADDDAPAVFIREDLVLKEKYNGEKLTKTPLPVKRNNVAPVSSFEVRSPFADLAENNTASSASAEPKAKTESKDKKKKDGHGQAPARSEKHEDSSDISKNGGKDKPAKNNKPVKNAGNNNNNNKGGRPSHDGGDQGKNRPQKPQAPKPQQGEGNGKKDGKSFDGNGKKPYRPFHKRGGNNNKNGGNGGNSAN